MMPTLSWIVIPWPFTTNDTHCRRGTASFLNIGESVWSFFCSCARLSGPFSAALGGIKLGVAVKCNMSGREGLSAVDEVD